MVLSVGGYRVSRSGVTLSEVFQTADRLASRLAVLVGFAAVFVAMAFVLTDPTVRLACAVAAGGMVALIVVIKAMAQLSQRVAPGADKALFDMFGQDAAPCFATNDIGEIIYQNEVAKERFGDRDAATLVSVLKSHFTAPEAVLYRLQNRAGHQGRATEDVVTRRGHLRLSVHKVVERQFLWRLEEFRDRVTASRGGDTLSLPMFVANKAGVVLFCNDAARKLVSGRPKRLENVFNTDRLHSGEEVSINTADGPIRAILAEVEGPSERREIYLLPVASRQDDRAHLTDFEELPVALMKFAPSGALMAANRAARELVRVEAAAGAMAHELFEGLGRPVGEWLADIADDRLPGGSEVLRVHGADVEEFLQITLRRIVELGRPAVLAVLQDATKLKTLEAQFVQSQKMQAIGQLAGGVAHDFNNLLTAISGHCDLLLLRHGREDTDYGDLLQISQNANRAAALVSQLLAFSRKQTLKLERIALQDVLSDLMHLLNRLVGEKVRLRVAYAPDLGTIRADKRQFEQVIMNLVVNARDAMPHGGTIRVETEALTLTEELHRNRARVPVGDYAVIRVQDSGIGIPEDKLEKIFEPFYTTKRPGEGTGLGLSTVYGIVKQSGGFIFVDSTPGEGTVFALYFPINETVDVDRPAFVATPRLTPRNGQGTVLLVEDEAPVRAFASRALRLRGYTVIEADCAEEALRALEDPAVEVDVFVTDVVMPGMDGPSWVKEALLKRPNVRVVFVSGYAEDVLSEEQSRIPNSVFLPKPFSLNELTITVQGALH